MSENATSTVFTQPTSTEPVTPPSVTPQPSFTLPQEVVDFIGTGKKYATTEDALKSVPHAQKHISTLEQELAQAKQELERRRTAEELLEEIKATTSIPSSQSATTVSTLDTNAVQSLVVQALQQEEAKKSAQSNISIVTTNFKNKFGDQAEAIYIKLAQDTGLSVQYLNDLSATSPTAVLKLAGLDTKQTQSVVMKPTNSVNVETFTSINNSNDIPSARVGKGNSTKDLVAAWKNAGKRVGKTN